MTKEQVEPSEELEVPAAQYDSPWKVALELGTREFFAEYLPDVCAEIDWEEEWFFLDQELHRMFPESEMGPRRVDRLIRFKKLSGDPLYAHIEVQAFFDEHYGPRKMTYRHRLRDRYGTSVLSISVLADHDPKWYLNRYAEGQFGSSDICTFRTIKLLRLAKKLAAMEASPSIFPLFVAAHLEAMRTRKDAQERRKAKFRLLSNLLSRKMDLQRGADWLLVIGWILPLPRSLNDEVLLELEQMHGENIVNYVCFAEEKGIEKGQRTQMRRLLEKRHGPLSKQALERLESCSKEALQRLEDDFLAGKSLADLGLDAPLNSVPPQA